MLTATFCHAHKFSLHSFQVIRAINKIPLALNVSVYNGSLRVQSIFRIYSRYTLLLYICKCKKAPKAIYCGACRVISRYAILCNAILYTFRFIAVHYSRVPRHFYDMIYLFFGSLKIILFLR